MSKALREVIVRALGVALQAERRAKAQAGGRDVSFVEERPEEWNELGKRVGCALTRGCELLKNIVTMLTFSLRWAVSGEL